MKYSSFFSQYTLIFFIPLLAVLNLQSQDCSMLINVNLSNANINAATTFTNQNIRINGTVNFNANVNMIGCRVLITAGSNLNINNSTFTLTDNAGTQSIIFGCSSMWQAINVNANAAIIFRNSSIRDGMSGIVINPGFLNASSQITGCTFSRNSSSITATNVNNLTFSAFSGNTFNGPTPFDPLLPPHAAPMPVNAFRFSGCVGSIGTAGPLNTIRRMTTGIRMINGSNLNLNNFTIQTCNTVDNQNGGVGIGIQSLASSLTIQNVFSNGVSCTFNNNGRAISSSGTVQLVVRDANFFSQSVRDIEVINSVVPNNIAISNNVFTLSAPTLGSLFVNRAAQPGGVHTSIHSNILNLPAGGGPLAGNIRFIDVLNNPGTTDQAIIANNQITCGYGNGPGAGSLARTTDAIWIQGNADGYQVSGNILNFVKPNGGVPPNNLINGVGIGMVFNNGTNNVIGPNNTIRATLFPGQANQQESWLRCGVHVDGSVNTLVCKNDVDEPRSCYHFNGNCGSSEFGRNVIRDGFFGLWMTNIVFPNQDFRMNEWVPGSLYTSTNSVNVGGAASLPWRVDPNCLPGHIAPPVTVPAVFQVNQPNNCTSGSSICDAITPTTPGGGGGLPLASNANDFIHGKLNFSRYAESWDFERNLLAQMIRFPSTFANDATASKYFAQKEHTAIWNFAKAERMLHDASEIDEVSQRTLNGLNQQMEQQVIDLGKIEVQEGKEEGVSAEFQEEKSQILMEMAALNQKMSSIQEKIADERLRRNAVVAEFIKQLPESNALEYNQKAMLNHQLKLQQGESISKSELAVLRRIANSCPKTGGEAVSVARGYLPASEGYAFMKEGEGIEGSHCSADLEESVERTHIAEEGLEVLLFPNPANDRVTVGFNQKFSGSLSLVTLDGRVIRTQQCDNSIAESLDVSSLPTGLYLIQLRDLSGKSETRKLSIAH